MPERALTYTGNKQYLSRSDRTFVAIFGKKLLRACVYCLQKPNSNKVFLSYSDIDKV